MLIPPGAISCDCQAEGGERTKLRKIGQGGFIWWVGLDQRDVAKGDKVKSSIGRMIAVKKEGTPLIMRLAIPVRYVFWLSRNCIIRSAVHAGLEPTMEAK